MQHKAIKGFTLIEVMIVVAIIAILAAVAIPSYRNHVCKVERNQAKSDLMGLAQAMERFYTMHNFSYEESDGSDPTAEEVFRNHSPGDGTERFQLEVTTADKTSFLLTATRTAGGCDGDGPYTLNSAGVKSVNWDE